MKKWHLILMSFILFALTPNMVAEAASLGSRTIYVSHDLWASGSYNTSNIQAKAGTLTICGYGDNSGATTLVYIEERDEAGNNPEFITQVNSHNFYNSCLKVNIPSSFVDGSDNQAEIRMYAERTDSFQSSKSVSFSFSQ